MTQAEVDAVIQARKEEYSRKKKELLELYRKTERELAVLKAEFHAGNAAVEARKDRTGDNIKRDAYNLQRIFKKRIEEFDADWINKDEAQVAFNIGEGGVSFFMHIPKK